MLQALRSCNSSHNPVYVSPGHRVTIETAVRLVQKCCKYRVPEPVRLVRMFIIYIYTLLSDNPSDLVLNYLCLRNSFHNGQTPFCLFVWIRQFQIVPCMFIPDPGLDTVTLKYRSLLTYFNLVYFFQSSFALYLLCCLRHILSDNTMYLDLVTSFDLFLNYM